MTAFLLFINRYHLWVSGILLFIITTLSLSPLPELPAAAGSDKAHHFIAYASLILPIALAQHKRLLWFFMGFALYSGVIELIQPYVNRYGEWLDMAANTIGLLVGILLAKAFLLISQYVSKTA